MYHNMYIIIICILNSVKTLLSRGTYYGEESNQLHHPGGSICSAVHPRDLPRELNKLNKDC